MLGSANRPGHFRQSLRRCALGIRLHGAFGRSGRLRAPGSPSFSSNGGLVDSREKAAAFNGVFAAKSPAELALAYDGWAETYDRTLEMELAGDGENHPRW
jgi:hypothetical protein